MNKSKLEPNKKYWTVCTLMVQGGNSTAISKYVSGHLIEKLENVLEEIAESEGTTNEQ